MNDEEDSPFIARVSSFQKGFRDMYAIVDNNGRQVKVKQGDLVLIDTVDLKEGDAFTFPKVLLYSDGKGDVRVGQPVLENVKVSGTVAGLTKGPKLVAFKYRRREGWHRKIGHRQKYNQVKIESIVVS